MRRPPITSELASFRRRAAVYGARSGGAGAARGSRGCSVAQAHSARDPVRAAARHRPARTPPCCGLDESFEAEIMRQIGSGGEAAGLVCISTFRPTTRQSATDHRVSPRVSLCGHFGRRRTIMGRSEFDYLPPRPAWNAGRKVGAKRPLKPRQIWAIRFHLDREHRLRDRALFDLAIDSKLRGCDLVKIKIGDLVAGGELRTRAMVIQQKTNRPVQFEIMSDARGSLLAWLERRGGSIEDFAFPSRVDHSAHMSTRQYARLVDEWVTAV